MTPKKHKTRDVSRDHYTTYRKKAKEFLNSNGSLPADQGMECGRA